VRVSCGVGSCVFDSALYEVVRFRRRVEHVLREHREGVRDGEANRVRREEVFGCLRKGRFVCGVARIRVGFGMSRMLREVNQARPHQTMKICDPERNRSARKADNRTARTNVHCPAIDDLFASLGDGEKSSRDGFQELGANPVHLVHDTSS